MSFSVTILGSSSALPTSNRSLTAHLLNVDERFFLIDCGEGTQIQLRKFKAKFARLDHIFITHLHGDHVFGLPGLISSFNLMGRKHDLHIYAHIYLEKILNQYLSNFFEKLDFKIIFHSLNLSSIACIFEDNKMEVLSFPLKHRVPTCGFIFKEKKKLLNIKKDMIDYYSIPLREVLNIKNGSDYITDEGLLVPNSKLTHSPSPLRSYAFCSDTGYTEEIIPHIKGVTLLYHEATFCEEDMDRASETFHSTAASAAKIAKLANAQKLIIGHFSARYKDVSVLLEEAKKIFPNTETVEDGMIFSI